MGCADCKCSPKTYEEYCIGQKEPGAYCPDAYTDISHLCGNYGGENTQQESEDKNERAN